MMLQCKVCFIAYELLLWFLFVMNIWYTSLKQQSSAVPGRIVLAVVVGSASLVLLYKGCLNKYH